MVDDGLRLSRKQRRTFHEPRFRRESYGERVQIDATSRLLQLPFVPSESTSSHFDALQGLLRRQGCPVAFYSDKHSVFRMNRDTPAPTLGLAL